MHTLILTDELGGEGSIDVHDLTHLRDVSEYIAASLRFRQLGDAATPSAAPNPLASGGDECLPDHTAVQEGHVVSAVSVTRLITGEDFVGSLMSSSMDHDLPHHLIPLS